MERAADGAAWMDEQLGSETNIWQGHLFNSNTRIGEQVDPWGHGLSTREGQGLNSHKTDEESSGWGRIDGQLNTGTLEALGRHPSSIPTLGLGTR